MMDGKIFTLPITGKIASTTTLEANSRRWRRDRKSTRLNSSHLVISYAVFCLKKKSDLVRERERLGLVVGDVNGRKTEVALQPLELGAHADAQLGLEIGYGPI